MAKVYEKWPAVHPIPKLWLQEQYKIARKKKNTKWKLVTKKRQILQWWTSEMAKDWLFNDSDLVLKSGGDFGVNKAYCCLYKSSNYIKVWIGVKGDFEGCLLVDGLMKAMKNLYEDQPNTTWKRRCLYIKVCFV